MAEDKGQFSTTRLCFFSSIQLGFVAFHFFPPSPFCFSSYSVNVFPPSFWYSTVLLSQGCYGDASFYTVGASVFFFPPPSRSCCLLSFVLDWLQILCKGMQPLFFCFLFFPLPQGLGWRSCHVCLLTASSSHSTRGWVGSGRGWTGISPPPRLYPDVV